MDVLLSGVNIFFLGSQVKLQHALSAATTTTQQSCSDHTVIGAAFTHNSRLIAAGLS